MEHGVGTTCISLALANYICSKLGKRTAYIELNTTNQISCLSPNRTRKKFTYMGISFFPAMTITSLPEVLNADYAYFILDMGILNTYTAKEFAKCNKQFLVCSLSKWRKPHALEKIAQFLKNNYINQEHVTVLANGTMKKSTSMISPKIKCRYCALPFIENPFQLATTDFAFFHHLLN